jgi:hypothetical protein
MIYLFIEKIKNFGKKRGLIFIDFDGIIEMSGYSLIDDLSNSNRKLGKN